MFENNKAVRAAIKKALKEVDEEYTDQVAALLVSTYRIETRDRYVFTLVAVIAALALEALAFHWLGLI